MSPSLLSAEYWFQDDDNEMDVDTATSATQAPIKHSLPELEIYCYLLVLIFLIDQKKYSEVGIMIISNLLIYFLFLIVSSPA